MVAMLDITWANARDAGLALMTLAGSAAIFWAQFSRKSKKETYDDIREKLEKAALTLEIANSENETLRARIDGLEGRLTEKDKLEAQMQKQIDNLTTENRELRNLVMLNTIPAPLQEFVSSVANKNYDAISELRKDLNKQFDGIYTKLRALSGEADAEGRKRDA